MTALTHWLATFPFLVHSKRHDSVFCLPYILFDKLEISQTSKFSKITGFHRSLRLIRRFQSIRVPKKTKKLVMKSTSVITLSIL